jgi:hypothetical protein
MGIITPEQGMVALKQGVYPDPKDLPAAQKKFVEEREKGYYTPLSVAQPIMEDQEEGAPLPETPTMKQDTGRPPGTKTKKDGIFASDELHSRKNIQRVVYNIEGLRAHAEAELKKHFKRKRLSKQHKEMLDTLSESIVISTEACEWEKTAADCIKDFDNIEKLEVMTEVLEISQEHELVSYPAAILYHSKKIKPENK